MRHCLLSAYFLSNHLFTLMIDLNILSARKKKISVGCCWIFSHRFMLEQLIIFFHRGTIGQLIIFWWFLCLSTYHYTQPIIPIICRKAPFLNSSQWMFNKFWEHKFWGTQNMMHVIRNQENNLKWPYINKTCTILIE